MIVSLSHSQHGLVYSSPKRREKAREERAWTKGGKPAAVSRAREKRPAETEAAAAAAAPAAGRPAGPPAGNTSYCLLLY
jgi:hypothetical protein